MNNDQFKYEEFKLLSLLAEDSEYAFQLLYDRHRNRIYQTAVRFLKSPSLAQEVVQDVFMKLWYERRNLKPGHPLEAWLYTVAKNNILNRLKKIASEWKALDNLDQRPSLTDPGSTRLEDAEYLNLLKQAVASLPPQQQKVFELIRMEKFSYLQVAEALKISPLTVKTHMSRSLRQIRQYLKEQGVDLPLMLLFFSFF